jgi:hypothetical protein
MLEFVNLRLSHLNVYSMFGVSISNSWMFDWAHHLPLLRNDKIGLMILAALHEC